ncbi:ABC transporter permease [Paenibacillus thermotolerans]|uniref:ABC transporter permease n=1 Tax=Paenibacillus thermotolerans TaxID=3027807 RepID=UPI002368B93E|nr:MULTISPECIES: ABC transporter permease [unclassified Paenibacillus]
MNAELWLSAFYHLFLSLLGTLLGGSIGLLLGLAAYRYRRTAAALLSVTEVIQTIPHLAMLALLLLVFGLGNATLVAALALYAILPILQNTLLAFRQIDPVYLNIGRGMGMTRWQLFAKVEFPLAFTAILTGVRIALVTSIGIAAIGVFVGADGLGRTIYRGLQTMNTGSVLMGAAAVCGLVIVSEIAIRGAASRFRTNQKQ